MPEPNEVKPPEDEGKIIIPDGYNDPIIVREHFAQKGENVVTCNMTVQDPLKKIGEEVVCGTCGAKFTIVLQSQLHKQDEKSK